MTSDKRNAAVVVALIASITGGVLVLLAFENLVYPRRPRYAADINLTALTPAERAAVEVEVLCVTDEKLAPADDGRDVFRIEPNGEIARSGELDGGVHGQRVRLVVICPDGRTLADAQKRALLGALRTTVGDREADAAPVRIVHADGAVAPEELHRFLALKGIIRN